MSPSSSSPSLSLVGLAVIGKKNEPLYMCDCTTLLQQTGEASAAPAPTKDNEKNDDDDDDVFGFVEASRTGPIYSSLAIQHQFLMHAALDRLEEMVDTKFTASPNNNNEPGMAVRRVPSLAPATSHSGSGAHWLGLLLEDADTKWQVYGHATATNIKLFALVRRGGVDGSISGSHPAGITTSTGSGSSNTNADRNAMINVKNFLDQVHSNYIRYVMNGFHEVRGDVPPIMCQSFDQGIRRAVEEYYQNAKAAAAADAGSATPAES